MLLTEGRHVGEGFRWTLFGGVFNEHLHPRGRISYAVLVDKLAPQRVGDECASMEFSENFKSASTYNVLQMIDNGNGKEFRDRRSRGQN